jgi:hypothetical protein
MSFRIYAEANDTQLASTKILAVYLSSDGHSLVGPYRTKKKGLLPYIRDVGKPGQKGCNSTFAEMICFLSKSVDLQ